MVTLRRNEQNHSHKASRAHAYFFGRPCRPCRRLRWRYRTTSAPATSLQPPPRLTESYRGTNARARVRYMRAPWSSDSVNGRVAQERTYRVIKPAGHSDGMEPPLRTKPSCAAKSRKALASAMRCHKGRVFLLRAATGAQPPPRPTLDCTRGPR